VRQSAATPSPWNDEVKAAEYMGGYAPWQAFLDPGGRSALVATCFRGTQCTLDMVVDGQPVQRVRDPATAPDQSTLFGKPTGAVRAGESWFFVTTTPSSPFELTVWRSDLGVPRALAVLPRPRTQGGYLAAPPPQLVRRAQGSGVGLLFSSKPEQSDAHDVWYVIPIDGDDGSLGDPIALGRKDLDGVPPPVCDPRQDGWVVDTALGSAPAVEVRDARADLGGFEARLRLDPGAVCVESLAAVIDGVLVKAGADRKDPAKVAKKVPAAAGARAVSLAATEKATGNRWGLSCVAR
jgi:hypothetical protein